jgi:hypothetical protein
MTIKDMDSPSTLSFKYGTEHRANQAICRLFDKGLIESLLDAHVLKTPCGKFTIETFTHFDNINVFSIK